GFTRRVRAAQAQWTECPAAMEASAAEALPGALAAFRSASACVTEANLHALRITGKRARYLAEAMPGRDAKRLVAELRAVQDAIGTWHDSVVLTESAEEFVTGPGQAAFLAALRAH